MEYTLKKSLGQHFLKDESVCVRIVDALQQDHLTQLVEVGPGGGALTKFLLKLSGIDFRAVEIDDEKVAFLQKQFPKITGKIIEKGSNLPLEYATIVFQDVNNPEKLSGYPTR